MRKLLFTLIIVLLLAFSVNLVYKGFTLGDFEILGITKIIEKNDEIDASNDKLSKLVSEEYQTELKTLKNASETLEQTKKAYESQAILFADSKYYGQSEKYKIEFLWTKLGNYAKDNKVEIKIDVTNSDTAELYNLNFTVNGTYSDVTEFIYDIEGDSELGFKIENFNMTAGSDVVIEEIEDENGGIQQVTASGVQATFSCKDIRIDLKQVDSTGIGTVTTPTQGNAENNATVTENTENPANTTQNTTTTTDTTTTTMDTTDNNVVAE